MIKIESHQLDLATTSTAFEVLGQQNGLSQTYWSEKALECQSIIKALQTYQTWSQPTLKDIRDRLDRLAEVCETLTDQDIIASENGRIFWHDRCQLILGLSDHLTDQLPPEPISPASPKMEPATH